MCRIRPDRAGADIGLNGVVEIALALAGESQIKPMFEFFRSDLGQLRAEPLRRIHVVAGKGRRGQAFECHRMIRAQGQKLLGVFSNRVVIFFLEAQADQIQQSGLEIGRQLENLVVDRFGFIKAPQQLERYRLAKQTRWIGRIRCQAFIEDLDRFRIILLMQRADANGRFRFQPPGIRRQGALKMRNGFLGAAQILQRDAAVERNLRIARLKFQSFRVALPGIFKAAQLQLEVRAGREDFGRLASIFQREIQIAQRVLGLTGKVMGNGLRERTRYFTVVRCVP